MPKIVNIRGEEVEVFPECCQKVHGKCYQCIEMEGKAPCRYYVLAHMATSGNYVISGTAAMLRCCVRTVKSAIHDLGLSPKREGHRGVLNTQQLEQVSDYLASKRSPIITFVDGALKVTASTAAEAAGLTRGYVDRLVRERKISGFVSTQTYVDAACFDKRYATNISSLKDSISARDKSR